MRDLAAFDHQMIQVTDRFGHIFTGEAEHQGSGYCFHEYGRDDEALIVSGFLIYAGNIGDITALPNLRILRATETWQQAGAYYVRIQAMARKHHITLRQEFDGHDGPETKYIVVTDSDFPIATARMYPLDEKSMMIGRVVVLPEYRRRGIGRMVVDACETWADELFFSRTVVESRENKVGFYEAMGYEAVGELKDGDTFRCVRMEKEL